MSQVNLENLVHTLSRGVIHDLSLARTVETTVLQQLQEMDSNGLNPADTQSADTTASAGTDAEVTSFSNASIAAAGWVGIDTASISGTPTRLHVTFYYREDP